MGHIFECDRLADNWNTVKQVGYKVLVSLCRIRKLLCGELRETRHSREMCWSDRMTPIRRRGFGKVIEYFTGLLARRQRCQGNVGSGRRESAPETS